MLPGCFLMLGEPRPVRAPVGLVLVATTRCPKAVELDRAQLGAADIAAAACRLGTRLDAVLAADLVKDAPDLVGGARGQLIALRLLRGVLLGLLGIKLKRLWGRPRLRLPRTMLGG